MVTSYKLYGSTELKQLSERLQSICNKWKTRWFVGGSANTSFIVEALQDKSSSEFIYDNYFDCNIGSSSVIVMLGSQSLNVLLARLLNIHVSHVQGVLSAVSKDVAENCITDLIAALTRSGVGEISPWLQMAESPEINTKSGCIHLALTIDDTRLGVLLPWELLKHHVDVAAVMPPSPLTARADLDIDEKTQLSVRVGSTELEYGMVTNLGIGDVIRLNSRIDQPLAIETIDGQLVCNAYVGTHNGHKAAKVILNK